LEFIKPILKLGAITAVKIQPDHTSMCIVSFFAWQSSGGFFIVFRWPWRDRRP